MEILVRGGDIDDSIRKLKKMMSVDGVLFLLKMRSLYPNLTDRAKAKARRSIAKRKRAERRREAAEAGRERRK